MSKIGNNTQIKPSVCIVKTDKATGVMRKFVVVGFDDTNGNKAIVLNNCEVEKLIIAKSVLDQFFKDTFGEAYQEVNDRLCPSIGIKGVERHE